MTTSPRATRNLAEVVSARLAKDRGLARAVEAELFNIRVSEELHRARTEAGLTQKQLAERAGTRQSVISRLEDADYAGHSLAMLRRLAAAVGKRLEVRFVDTDAQRPDQAVVGTAPARRKRRASRRS
jgi:ribosome-binding protein aMBF1 (putative translation factor)